MEVDGYRSDNRSARAPRASASHTAALPPPSRVLTEKANRRWRFDHAPRVALPTGGFAKNGRAGSPAIVVRIISNVAPPSRDREKVIVRPAGATRGHQSRASVSRVIQVTGANCASEGRDVPMSGKSASSKKECHATRI